jgi:ABC-type transporter Mla subunit MlaD
MRHVHNQTNDANRQVVHALDQIASQIRATNDFSQELEKKLTNILAVVRTKKGYPIRAQLISNISSLTGCRSQIPKL